MNTKLLPVLRRSSRASLALACGLCICGQLNASAASPPVVSSVTATQHFGTKLVDIGYFISDPDSTNVNVHILVSPDGGTNWNVPAYTCSGNYGINVAVTSTPVSNHIVWDAGADWDRRYTEHCRVRVLANDAGLVLIPPGSYLRGNPPALGDTDITDAPQYPVYVSAFFVDATEVSGRVWSGVYAYASSQGYSFDNAGAYKAESHPVQNINWFDAVKWCNARSQREGLAPVYHTDAGFATVYKTGQTAPYWKPGANGYRLPTEAEWEKAARNGLSGNRFPWRDTISESLANYFGDTTLPYDSGPNGYNQTYTVQPQPYTSPIGAFAANGYGLSDIAGNVVEWCWDWYLDSYYISNQTDPQGPDSGSLRVLRGGSWNLNAGLARCASRSSAVPSATADYYGFRCVRWL